VEASKSVSFCIDIRQPFQYNKIVETDRKHNHTIDNHFGDEPITSKKVMFLSCSCYIPV
jgi:hypothetical protein